MTKKDWESTYTRGNEDRGNEDNQGTNEGPGQEEKLRKTWRETECFKLKTGSK